MASPSLSYLALDSSYDPIFADNSSLTGAKAVAQTILTSLNFFQGEWWEDLTLGFPVFQQILNKIGSQQTLKTAQSLIQAYILSCPYVVSVYGVNAQFINGQISIYAEVLTAFGPVTVSNVAGLSAGVGQ